MFAKMARGSYGRKGGYVDYAVSPGNLAENQRKSYMKRRDGDGESPNH